MKKFSHGCTLDCADICKFNVYIDNGKIKIEGDKNHPYTKGFICSKGHAHLDRLNHEKRIYTPLLKVNGEWREISFEKAIDIISEKLNFYKENFTQKSIMYYTEYGSGSVLKDIGEIFFNFFGGASISDGGPCWSAGIKAQKYDFGSSKSNSLDDLLNSKNIFVWGKNPANTSIHTMKAIIDAKNNGSKIIVIDPIETETAKFADIYIRINSGSDGALAIAMAKIIIEKNLIDKEFIDKYVVGFEEYKKYIDTLNLDELSNQCGVSIEKINELVNLYTQKYSSILIGYGMQKYFNGGNNIRIIDSLSSITGQVGFSGGGVNYANKVYSNTLNSDPYESYKYADNRVFDVSNISNFINENSIKMAVVTKSNMLNQLPNLVKLKESFRKIEFKVCFDLFMTDTAKECDLFIPCTNTLETEDLLFSSMTNPYLVYNEKVVEPNHELMDEYLFFMKLSQKLNLKNYHYVSKEEYLNKVIKPLKKYDISLDKIKDSYFTIHDSVAWREKIFETKSKKIEIYSEDAKNDGQYPLPTYIKTNNPFKNNSEVIGSNEKLNSTTNNEKLNKTKNNKYRLLTTHAKNSLSSQHFLDDESLATAYINKNTANKENVKDNDKVYIKNSNSDCNKNLSNIENKKIKVTIKITEKVGDNTILMYAGYWQKNSNPNYVTVSESSDMGGQIAYNETFVSIKK